MESGNEIDHLAAQALREGYAQTMWLGMRNAYFRAGTPNEGWAAMVAAFDARGVAVSEREQHGVQGAITMVCLHPKPR